jgi:sugar-specific transcriptional regulator TrmB
MSLDNDIATVQQAGLTKTEASVYLYVLRNGISKPPEIAHGLNLQRPNLYQVLTSLVAKGLLDRKTQGKRAVYLAKDPDALTQLVAERQRDVDRVVPDLRALASAAEKPVVEFVSGIEQVKDLFFRIDGAKEIRFVISTDVLFENYPKQFAQYRKRLFDTGVFVRDILTQPSGVGIAQKTREEMRGYYEYRLFPKKYEDMPTSIRMWNDYVALVTFGEPAFATVLKDAALAKTFKVMFETMWSSGSTS